MFPAEANIHSGDVTQRSVNRMTAHTGTVRQSPSVRFALGSCPSLLHLRYPVESVEMMRCVIDEAESWKGSNPELVLPDAAEPSATSEMEGIASATVHAARSLSEWCRLVSACRNQKKMRFNDMDSALCVEASSHKSPFEDISVGGTPAYTAVRLDRER